MYKPTVRVASVAALALFLIATLLFTFPLILHLTDSVEDRQDALLNVWITAWDGHQLLSDPFHLFDANIFHPYPRTLAFSELLLGNALLALPITALTGNPVLGYNVALLLSFVLSGFGTYLLVIQLTRSWAAGILAGLVFAFCSYRMTNLAQAQLLTTQWMPFALLSLYQFMHQPRPRHLAAAVLFFCLQALSSFYYGILLAMASLGFLLWMLATDPATRSRQTMALLLVGGGVTALILLPFALPYFQVQRELGFERTLADSEPFSASLRQYLMAPPRSVLHGRWLPSDDTPRAGGYPVDALFPGLAVSALALWGLIRGTGSTRWFFGLLLVAAALLSLGPRLYLAPGQPSNLGIALPYAWLYAVVPGFKALRAPVRFDALVMLSLAVLAGYGVAALFAPTGDARIAPTQRARRGAAIIATLLVGLVLLESWVWPAARAEAVPTGDRVPAVYRWLANQSRRPVLEYPLAFTPGGPQLEYQYFSAYHWQTTPDGYSGFIPPKHGQIVYEMERFPAERSIRLLQALGIDTLLIHTDRLPAARWREIQAALPHIAELTPLSAFDAVQAFQVQPGSFNPAELTVRGYLPTQATAGEPTTAYLIAINRGLRSYALPPTASLHPTVTWQEANTGQEAFSVALQAGLPLVTSPNGGAAVIPLSLQAPTKPGVYQLRIAEQGGPLGDWQVEGPVEVGAAAVQENDAFPVPAQLVGWDVAESAQAGKPLAINLSWRALGKIDAYYSVYVKLLDSAGRAVTGWDGQPRNGEAPTLLWAPGEVIQDQVTLQLPADTPPGDYTLEVGMYRAEDLARGLTLNEEGVPLSSVEIGRVRVEP